MVRTWHTPSQDPDYLLVAAASAEHVSAVLDETDLLAPCFWRIAGVGRPKGDQLSVGEALARNMIPFDAPESPLGPDPRDAVDHDLVWSEDCQCFRPRPRRGPRLRPWTKTSPRTASSAPLTSTLPSAPIIRSLPGFGYSAALENVGTSAAPLLAGFSFALITLVVAYARYMAAPSLALVLLVLAALLLINAVQYAVRAREHYLPPDELQSLLELAPYEGLEGATVRSAYSRELGDHRRASSASATSTTPASCSCWPACPSR